jgi:CRISPR-associated endonuclease/helicase Cas3
MFEKVEQVAGPDVGLLLHSQFPLQDRQEREKRLANLYGPTGARPKRGIVIGTQVLEQSLDLDFDVMVSDLAPMDYMLQRAGRLHRHAHHDDLRIKAHSKPRLYLNTQLGPDGSLKLSIVDKMIYDEFTLRQTWETLAGRNEINLPADYRLLIEAVYGAAEPALDSLLAKAWRNLQSKMEADIEEADQRLIPMPDPRKPLSKSMGDVEFIEDEDSAAWIAGRTRLGLESVAVIPLVRDGETARLFPTTEKASLNEAASAEMQLQLARRHLRVSRPQAVPALKEAAKPLPRLFTASARLKGYLPLWLDQDGRARLPTKRGVLELTLDPKLGLVIRKGE